ncbi:MAG: hypothetical protein JO300_08740 [Silvibacterium sp.]|nr:hypothetical protein [Silvibacterium sp.]
MKSRSLRTLIGLLAVVTAAAQEPAPNRPAFLVRMSWSELELSPDGINRNDCLLVFPDGHFHMEQRFQQLPKTEASLRIHESLLSNAQLDQLRSLLNQRQVVTLPQFVPFHLVVPVRLRRGFQAEISRNQETVQRVGYMEWEVSKHDDAHYPTSEALEKSRTLDESQQPARTTLRPLLQWLLKLESQQPAQGSGESTLCELE